ncbi:CPBP family intramembrane glutamic endopeptidase [Nocardiopsis sp. HUAS JQ3]|uniref:CPBP family intramembrane glutamic endopeptidase n=1 Tax=Nocardiopsis sp. HUAS JQ3 TaxID=3061629 RepID=UPI0023A9F7EC|nr:CPBP family intramembrane glutamic endopeptidase [Nocardiopsis sp. HUAS JQ3]WDZ91869.1 CPBP family intramembrane metalloprotease [Nocardiopsis sp. HUAS JQ3]
MDTTSARDPGRAAPTGVGRLGHRADPLLGTRVRLRDAVLLGAVTVVSGALLLGAGLLVVTLTVADWPPAARVVLAFGPLLLLTPLVACAAGHALLMRRGPRLTLSDVGLVKPNRVPVGLLLWIPLAIASAALSTGAALGVVSLLGVRQEGGFSSSSEFSGLVAELPLPASITIALGTVLLFPFFEELLFRGMLHGALTRHTAPWAAVALSAVVFSLVHVAPLLMPYTLVLGLWLGWLHRRYESIIPSVVLHCCNNGLAVAITHGVL